MKLRLKKIAEDVVQSMRNPMLPGDDDYDINYGKDGLVGKDMKRVKEAKVDTPGQVMQKAQLAKTRADMKQLSAKQKTLGASKRNAGDTTSKRRLSKQIADLGVKKADLGIKTAEMSQQLKKPKMEGAVNESNLDSDMEDSVMIIAKNERKFYDKRDAKGAIDFAIKEYIKGVTQDMMDDLTMAKTLMVRDLQKYWNSEGR